MGKQVTEMLKGTLEGIVLAILSGRPAYGYEITAWLREKGFSDIAEGTVYALLDQDRAARPRRRGEGPLREGAAAQGLLPQRPGTRHISKSSGGPGASSQNGSNSSAKEADDHVHHRRG